MVCQVVCKHFFFFFFLLTPCMCWFPQNCQYSCECLFQHPPPILFHFGANRVPAYARCACVSVRSGHYTWHYSFFLFFLFFSHSLTFLPEGVCQGSWNIPRSGRWSACTMGKWDPLWQTQYYVTKHLISLLWTCYSLIVKYIIEIFKSKKWLFEFFFVPRVFTHRVRSALACNLQFGPFSILPYMCTRLMVQK